MHSDQRSLSLHAIGMGLLAAFVGYAASSAIVLSGLSASGANSAQAATGLFFASLGMGLCSIALAWKTRTPAAIAWSTPGAALLSSAPLLPQGFEEAIGAFIGCALLIILTGLLPVLNRAIASIPKPLANALLAGVLLKLCLAPAQTLGVIPLLVLPIIAAWLIGMLWHKLAAMPLAVISFVVVLSVYLNQNELSAELGMRIGERWMPQLDFVMPVFTTQAFISIAIPLYLVTMAGQNIPGFAVLELNGFKVNRPPLLRTTGIASLLVAPFGSVPVNMSAITAAMMCGEDAGKHKNQRYWAAIVCGIAYVALAFAAEPITQLASIAPDGLIPTVAGLALIPALVASLSAAFVNHNQPEAPALTFLLTASGMTLIGISGAFWGVILGLLVWRLTANRTNKTKKSDR